MKTMTIDGQEYVLVPKKTFEELSSSNYTKEIDTSDLAIHNISFECQSETDDDLFEFSVLVDEEDGDLVVTDMVSTKWTNKRVPKSECKSQCWDSKLWLLELSNTNDRLSIDEFPEEIDEYGFKVVQVLMLKVIDLGWLGEKI